MGFCHGRGLFELDGFFAFDQLYAVAVGFEEFLVFSVHRKGLFWLDGVDHVDEFLFVHVA